jgi:hypothetical protein
MSTAQVTASGGALLPAGFIGSRDAFMVLATSLPPGDHATTDPGRIAAFATARLNLPDQRARPLAAHRLPH